MTCTWESAPEVHSRSIEPREPAMVTGRDFVIPDDVKTLAVPVLAHRVLGKSFLHSGEFGAAEAIIRDIVDRVRVPS